jgi:hypothetical protein
VRDGEELTGELARLRNAVACELHAQLAMRNEKINLADVPEIAYAVAVRLGYDFRIEWAPSWETSREDDESLGLDSAVFYGSDLAGVTDRYPVFDHGWPTRRP